ncbi:MAG TPA: hypothetical protein GXX28_10485 [Firmicutes bacterium]|nr:hypothetical protein [Bacillota bacterium]
MLDVLPSRYFELLEYDGSADVLSTFEAAYHLAFDMAANDIKEKVAKQFVNVLKQGNGHTVRIYESKFFRPVILASLSPDDAVLVKQHLLGTMKSSIDLSLLRAVVGIEFVLTPGEIVKLVDSLVLAILNHRDERVGLAARDCLERTWWNIRGEAEDRYMRRLNTWIQSLTEKGKTQQAAILQEFKASIVPGEDDTPF